MRITTKKCVNHMEHIEEEYEVRVQISKGKIITMVVNVDDGEIGHWHPKTKSDYKINNRLSPDQRSKLEELIEEMGIDE